MIEIFNVNGSLVSLQSSEFPSFTILQLTRSRVHNHHHDQGL